LPLSPSQETAKFVSELFPGVTNFEGMLELSAPQTVAAVAIRQNLLQVFQHRSGLANTDGGLLLAKH
jgi:hypothetical protein